MPEKLPDEKERFLKVRFLAKVNGELDHEEMAQRGLSENRIEEYQRQYEFLREVLVVLG